MVLKKIGHGSGRGQATFHSDGGLLTCGADGYFRRHNVTQSDMEQVKEVEAGEDELNAIAISKNGKNFVVGGKDHEVLLYSWPECEKQTLLARCPDSINCLAFSPRGIMVAVASDAPVIKMVNVHDSAQITNATGHEGAVKWLGFDSSGEFLASADCNGMLRVTKVSDATAVFSEKKFPKTEASSTDQMLNCCWHPDGDYLAVAGQADVEILKTGSWFSERNLTGVHSKAVSVIAWSPNGLYIATAGADNKLCIWDAIKQEDIDVQDLSSPCTSLSWSPKENAIVYTCDNGYLHKWNNPVPSHKHDPFTPATPAPKSETSDNTPTEKKETPVSIKEEPTTSMIDDDAEEVNEDDQEEEEEEEEEEGEKTKKALDASTVSNIFTTEASDNEDNSEPPHSSDDEEGGAKKMRRLKSAKKLKEKRRASGFQAGDVEEFGIDYMYDDGEDDLDAGLGRAPVSAAVDMQPPFQPGFTPEDSRKDSTRQFLAWNDVGSILSRDENTYHLIDIEFSDTSKHRNIRMRDHYHLTMAALGSHGAFFASKSRHDSTVGRTVPSTVYYHPTASWSNNALWTMSLQSDEEATSVAIGDTWAVCSTSLNFLRVFSYAGVQRAVLSLEGPVVTMVGSDKLLAIVYHRGAPINDNQNLGLKLMNMHTRKVELEMALPITPGSKLTWLGFGDNGMLLSMDSKGYVRGLTKFFGNTWVVLLDTNKVKQERENSRATYWPVALVNNELMVAICRRKKYPDPFKKPLLTNVSLQMPFLDGGRAQEEQHALKTVMLFQGPRPTLKQTVDLDKLVITQIQASCKQDKLVRALDLCTSLQLLKSLEIAITIANHAKKADLAERISMLLQAKQREQQLGIQQHNEASKENLGDAEPALSLSSTFSPDKEENSSKSKLMGRKRLLQSKKNTPSPKKSKQADASPPRKAAAAKKKSVNPFGI